jgi:drug/metabolite transporter (DMT)-like permease
MTVDPSPGKSGIPSSLLIWSAMISVYIVWGSTYLAIRLAVKTMPPFLMAGVRFLVAGSVLYLVRRAFGDPRPSWKEWRSAAVVGVFLLVGGNGGVVWAEQWVASGIAALLVGTAPLWMIFIDMFQPIDRRSNRWAIIGVVLGFLGIALLIDPLQSIGSRETIDPAGAGVLVLASLLWSIGSLYSRQAKLPSSPLLGTGMEMLAGGLGLLLLGMMTGELGRLSISSISKSSWLGWLYLLVFGSWIGFTAYTWLLRSAPTPLVSTYAYVNPIVAVLLGYFLASEPFTIYTLIAAVMVVGSVAFTTVSQHISFKKKTDRHSIQVSDPKAESI